MSSNNTLSISLDKVEEFTSFCGGLPAPEFADNPLGNTPCLCAPLLIDSGYKFSWSPRGVLNAAKANARFVSGGEVWRSS